MRIFDFPKDTKMMKQNEQDANIARRAAITKQRLEEKRKKEKEEEAKTAEKAKKKTQKKV